MFYCSIIYCFLYLEVNLDLGKTNQPGETSPNFIFLAVNLDSIVLKQVELMVNLDLTEVGRFKMPLHK